MLSLGETVPNFCCYCYYKNEKRLINFYQWLGNAYAILASHPADFTPVCTTELIRLSQMNEEFEKRGIRLLCISCDGIEEHCKWVKDLEHYGDIQGDFPFPLVADKTRQIAAKLGMLTESQKDDEGVPVTCRALYIVGPDKKIKLAMLYPSSVGRNFDELLRVIESLRLADVMKVSTPSDWKPGDDCMLPEPSDAETKELLSAATTKPEDVPSGRCYMKKIKWKKLCIAYHKKCRTSNK